MIFEQEQVGFTVLDVFLVDNRHVKVETAGRKFSALSFRLASNALIRSNAKTYTLSDGSVGYFPAGVAYTREAETDKMIVVHIENYTYFSGRLEFFTPQDATELRALFEKALAVWEARGDGYKSKTAAILNEIFARLYAENMPKAYRVPILDRLCRELEDNFRNPDLTVEDVAQKVGVSMSYFRRIFKKKYGISPKAFLLEKRFAYAAALLGTGYYSVVEVAAHSGFSDAKYFSVQFKKRMGCSPSKYAKEPIFW